MLRILEIRDLEGKLTVEIYFEELVNNCNNGNIKRYCEIRNNAIKQLSRCRFEIVDDKCVVKVKDNNEVVNVVFTNKLKGDVLSEYLYLGDEVSPKFMYNKLRNYNASFIDTVKEYKNTYFVQGKDIADSIWYKIYNREPLECKLRECYGATWIDYEKQLENGNVIYDSEGISGLWAMPAAMVSQCLNDECKEHYGNRVFVVKPVGDCFYLDDEKEIIGDRYEVLDKLSLENINDIGKLFIYLLNNEKKICEREIANINSKKEKLENKIKDLYDENRYLEMQNRNLKNMIRILFGVGMVIEMVTLFLK